MKLYPQHWRRVASDSEIIEAIRKNMKNARKLIWFWPVSALVMLLFALKFGDLFLSYVGMVPESKQLGYYGFLSGVLFGFMFCLTLAQAAVSVKIWLESKCDNRTEKLLLKYFDMYQKEQTSNMPLQSTPTCDDVGGRD